MMILQMWNLQLLIVMVPIELLLAILLMLPIDAEEIINNLSRNTIDSILFYSYNFIGDKYE